MVSLVQGEKYIINILIFGLIVFFTPVIYAIFDFHSYKIFGLICILVKILFSGKHP